MNVWCGIRNSKKAIAGAIAAGAAYLAAKYALHLPVGYETAISAAVGYAVVWFSPKNVKCD